MAAMAELHRVEHTDGYIKNNKRNTGFYFSELAADNFLRANGLTRVIRAHEVVQFGWRFHFNGKCVTVFSSSKYTAANNESACVYLERGDMRIVRLQTWQDFM